MKKWLLPLLFLASFTAKAQDSIQLAKLMLGDTMVVKALDYPVIFQKAILVNTKIKCTVLNVNQDLQMYVSYTYDGAEWTVDEIGKTGSFYAGNEKIGTIIPGGSANIPGLPNLGNERDIISMPTNEIWFTSDISGKFQPYKLNSNKAERQEMATLQNSNLVNLWSSSNALYFDAFSAEKQISQIFSWRNNKLNKIKFDGNSISFNDSLLVYIKSGKLKVLNSVTKQGIINFVFAFIDSSYENGITLSANEANLFGINDQSIIDGVLTDEAKEKIIETLQTNMSAIGDARKNDLIEKLDISDNLVKFTFFFLDNQYETGVTLSQTDASNLGIEPNSIIDGVITPEAKEKLIENLKNKKNLLSDKKREELFEKLNIKQDKTIEFYGFFADEETYISTNKLTDGVNSNGFISDEALQKFILETNDAALKEKLSVILIQRSWDEEKEIQITGKVIVQVGAYHEYFDDFPKYLYQKGKISKSDYKFLQSLTIITVFKEGLFLYRTETTVDTILKIKKTVYFDHPFIVTKE
jgi:hypothetical protein